MRRSTMLMLCLLSCLASNGLAQRTPEEVRPLPRADLAAPALSPVAPHLRAELFPHRDDLAWDGLAAGVVLGLLIGLGLNAAYADMGGQRSVGAFLGTLVLPVAVTAPLGLMIGSAIPRDRAPPAASDSARVQPQNDSGLIDPFRTP